MSYSEITQLAVCLSLINEKFSSCLERKSAKVIKTLKVPKELNELKEIYDMLQEVHKGVVAIEQQMNTCALHNMYLKGKLEHVQQILSVCYQDYKNNGRQDAMNYITIQMDKSPKDTS